MDTYLLEELKHANINISQMTEQAGRATISSIKSDVNGINEELTKLELTKLEKEIVKKQGRITKLRNDLETIEKARTEEQEEKLKHEQERIEKETKCPNCHNILSDNFILLKDDVKLCKACFGIKEVAQKYLKNGKEETNN